MKIFPKIERGCVSFYSRVAPYIQNVLSYMAFLKKFSLKKKTYQN